MCLGFDLIWYGLKNGKKHENNILGVWFKEWETYLKTGVVDAFDCDTKHKAYDQTFTFLGK